jgi:hypothetical protein
VEQEPPWRKELGLWKVGSPVVIDPEMSSGQEVAVTVAVLA